MQLFVFSRVALKQDVLLPWLELEPLSDEQVRELEKLILSDGSRAQKFSIVGTMSPTLRSLCGNPLLLRLTLEYWKRVHNFPEKIEFLFRSWLDAVLETEPSDAVSKVQREQALTALAQATAIAPVASAVAIARLEDKAIPAAVLKIIQCNAVRTTGAVVELQHEGLADYLRAKALAATSETELQRDIPTLPIPANLFFPVLLMAQLASRRLQSALWRRLSAGRISVYLDALRYRFDVSSELRELDSDRLSQDYLDELIDGVEIPLAGFFPEMRASVMGWLTSVENATLAATGLASAYPGALFYKLHAQEPGQPRVTAVSPTYPGTIRGVNLDRSRYRIDSARLLGMTLLRDTLHGAVKQLDVRGGPTWAAERLIGRVRYLAETYGVDVKLTDDLDKLEGLFKPYADSRFDEGGFLGKERFSIQSLLDDIATLRAAGETKLDPWWSRLGWDDNAVMHDEDVFRRVLDEEHRRIQTVYAEIVQASFPSMATEMIYFPILPVRWKLTVRRLDRREGLSALWFSWLPVASWEEAGADVTFTGTLNPPDVTAARDALAKLGRPTYRIPRFAGTKLLFPYDGTQPTGRFDGATAVTHEVCSWLEDDLKHLFEGLPFLERDQV